MNVEAVVIFLLLKSESRDDAINKYAELKREYFSPAYAAILQAISRFYDRHGKMPTLGELKLETSRSAMLSMSLAALETLDIPDIDDFDLALEILKDQFTQQQFLSLLSKSLEDISLKSSEEIMSLASEIPMRLEETIKPKTFLHTANDVELFPSEEEVAEDVMYSGISNKLDSEFGALRRQEVFLIGGRRGAGKSVICANIAKNAVNGAGLVVPYFSIEMNARETLMRYLAIESGVSAIKVRNKTLEYTDLMLLSEARANMFENGADILKSHERLATYEDFVELDKRFMREGVPTLDKGLIIIDDPELKMSAIDMYLTNLKAKYGKKLGSAIVDYVNQVVIDGANDITMYDWKNQTVIAKRLKALARKHDITIFAPYQVDESGEARMAKGILDSCDFAYIVEAVHGDDPEKGALVWKCTKSRGLPTVDFATPINWNNLRISSEELSLSEVLERSGKTVEPEDGDEKPKKKRKQKGLDDNEVLTSMELS